MLKPRHQKALECKTVAKGRGPWKQVLSRGLWLESIFCLLLVVKVFSLQKVVEMLEKEVVVWREVR